MPWFLINIRYGHDFKMLILKVYLTPVISLEKMGFQNIHNS